MSTFAAAVARGKNGWTASEIELAGLGDIDEVADRLLTLCALEGMMPADITAEIAQRLGCADELEELREV